MEISGRARDGGKKGSFGEEGVRGREVEVEVVGGVRKRRKEGFEDVDVGGIGSSR